VDRDLVVQGHDSKIPIAEFRDHGPESIPVALLPLDANGSLDDSDAPFPAKIGALPKYFSLEILGEPIVGHLSNLARPVTMPGAG
jgi:hypothetical protein